MLPMLGMGVTGEGPEPEVPEGLGVVGLDCRGRQAAAGIGLTQCEVDDVGRGRSGSDCLRDRGPAIGQGGAAGKAELSVEYHGVLL